MKPFNLEAAKAGAQVITRDGCKALIVCFDRKTIRGDFPIVTVVETDSGHECAAINKSDGTHGYSREYDLFMAPVKEDRWVNIYENATNAYLYKSEEIANAYATNSRIACIKIEYEV